MAASDDKLMGANKAVSNRVTKFRMPERTSRPPDDAYFDRVLSAVERKEPPPAEVDTVANISPETSSLPSINSPAIASEAASHLVQLRQADAANSTAELVNGSYDEPSTAAAIPPSSSRQVTALRQDTARGDSSQPSAPVSSLPRAQSLSFADFRRRWSLFLTDTHMNLCEEIFRNTAALGRDNYDTTASKLCQAVSKSRRHTFLLLQQLEKMGFVTRKEIKDNNRLLGIRIWFHLTPLQQ